MTTFKRAPEAAAAGLLVLAIAGAAFAQDAASAITARQTFMKGLTKQAGVIAAAAMNNDMPGAKAAAKTLDDGFKAFATEFPAGSDASAGKTRAKPEVWSDAAGFKTQLDKALAASARIVEAANGSDASAVTAAVGALDGNFCNSCHTPFRGPPV